MWAFTDDGFISVVEYDPPKTKWDKDAKKSLPVDDGIVNRLPADYYPADSKHLSSHLLVRARIQDDLNPLKTYDPDAIETEDKLADYQFRLVMRRTALAQYMYDKVNGLDYNSHVKETIEKRAPKIPGGRYAGLSAVWSSISRWQPNTPWGGTVQYGGYGGSYDSATGTTKYAGKPANSPTTSYYDSSLGKWITPKAGNHTFVGDATPKALPAGSAGRSEDAKVVTQFPTDEELDSILEGLDPDNPWTNQEPSEHLPLGETEDGLKVTAEATRNSMIAQVKDIVNEMGRQCEVEALVDELQETWGTVDIDTIPRDIIDDMTVSYESVSSILAAM
jgi:hypothetical protein